MPLVFSYGTLQQPEIQLSTFGRRLSGSVDELSQYELGRSGSHANVVFRPRSGGRVRGTAFEISDAELAAADRYEIADGYTRVEVSLASGRTAWIYLDIAAQRAGEHMLVTPGSPALWKAYHDIRRVVLFESRGDAGYNENHPDDVAAGNYPKLLLYRGEPVGAVRVDVYGPAATLRRVAIRADRQRRGHGRALLALAVDFLRRHDCRRVESHVAKDAVAFYRKCGFSIDADEPESVLMSKDVTA
ncbi:MAG TPA: GNAT family N-acetyltransferase [Vicinamibacterales bacterium]|nr:GNAT family N-acetyltransferase [Vicinamibacterales bacterium]